MRAVVGLGSNLGSREALLRAARDLLALVRGTRVTASSVIVESNALTEGQPTYLNAAVALESSLAPDELLAELNAIESTLGRVRIERWGARTLDLDLLWIDGVVVDTERLKVPHPELLNRLFALGPLLDVAHDARDPRTGRALLERWLALPQVATRTRLFDAAFPTETTEGDGGVVVRASNRADALAAAAEALAGACVPLADVTARESRRLECVGESGAFPDDEARLRAVLSAVANELDASRFAVRRVAVLDDAPARVSLVLLGEPMDLARHGTARLAPSLHLEPGCITPDGDERRPGWRARVVLEARHPSG